MTTTDPDHPAAPPMAEAAPIEEAGSVDAMRPSVSVVVPAYNEETILQRSLDTLHEYLHGLDDRYDWELVVVDDGSSDATPEIATGFAEEHDRVRVLRHRRNYNLGQALRFAFGTCRGDYVVTIDCDLSYSPDHIERLLETLVSTGAKIVIASPYLEGGSVRNVPASREALSRTANRFLSYAVKGDISTLTGMVRGYDRRFLSSLNLKAMDVEVNTEIIYKARVLRARIEEIPGHLEWEKREAGAKRQRVSSMRVGRSTAAYVFSGWLFRPVVLFVFPGAVLLLLAIALMLLVGGRIVFAGTGIEEQVSTVVITGITLLIAIQLLTLGLLALQAKRYFEELFHLGTTILRRNGGVSWPTGGI